MVRTLIGKIGKKFFGFLCHCSVDFHFNFNLRNDKVLIIVINIKSQYDFQNALFSTEIFWRRISSRCWYNRFERLESMKTMKTVFVFIIFFIIIISKTKTHTHKHLDGCANWNLNQNSNRKGWIIKA